MPGRAPLRSRSTVATSRSSIAACSAADCSSPTLPAVRASLRARSFPAASRTRPMLLAALRCKGHNTSNSATISMTAAVTKKIGVMACTYSQTLRRRQRAEPRCYGLQGVIVKRTRDVAHDEIAGGIVGQTHPEVCQPGDQVRRVLAAKNRVDQKRPLVDGRASCLRAMAPLTRRDPPGGVARPE